MRTEQDLQIRKEILHFCSLVETEAADHEVFSAITPKRFLNLTRLKIGSVQDRDPLGGALSQYLLDGVGYEQSLILTIGGFVITNLRACIRAGPEPLALA